MRKLFLGCAVFLSLAMLTSCGNKKQPASGDSALATGSVLFENNCVICHGGDGKRGMGGAADLSVSTLDHAAGIAIVKNGKNGMRSFAGELSDAEIDAVVAYAESLRKK